MSTSGILWLLQANDTAYPSGSYAHSFGLEELVASGVVAKPADLERYIEKQLIPALLKFEVPFLVRAHAAAQAGDVQKLLEIDHELDAWRIPAELRDASRRIGSQRLELLCRLESSDVLARYRELSPRSHHLIVTALELSNLSIAEAARALVFQAIVAATAASMKLIRIGQTACQQIARRAFAKLEERIDASIATPADGWFNPLLEIASLRHARATDRLFIS